MTKLLRAGVLALCLGALAGCAARSAAAPSAAGTSGTWPRLAAPQSLPQRSLAFSEADLQRDGSAFAPGLPRQRTSADGAAALFAPAGDQPAAPALAYAGYVFGVEDYDRTPDLRLSWTAVPDAGRGWLAVANYSTNRWDWFQLPASQCVELGSMADYTGPAPGYNVHVVVLLSGTVPARLEQLRIGAPPIAADAPRAVNLPDARFGPAPLDVDFAAGWSSAVAPATLVKFEYDFGEGADFEDFVLNDHAGHVYAAEGTYTSVVRVTDSNGLQATMAVPIVVSSSYAAYDEIEDNDDPWTGQANALGSLPVVGFRGSVGTSVKHPGNDGDWGDYYSFNASPGSTVRIQADFANWQDSVQLTLWSGGEFPGPLVLGSSGYGVDLALDYLVKAEDAQPFILEVLSTETGGRYLLNVTTGNPIGRLTATPDEGTAPFTVRLDASGSFDQAPGTVVSYEFAPLGREEYLPAQASPLLDYEYTVPGEFDYVPTVRVTDNAGNQAICFLTLTVH